MRFRCHRVALAADIENSFLMVHIKEADQDVLHFLWIDDLDNEHPNIVVKLFNPVVFGITSSPFPLNATVRYHVTKYEADDLQFVSDILTSLYVDDFNGGKDSVPEAFELYKRARSRIKEAGFNLKKGITSSEGLMKWIDEEEGAPVKEVVKLSEEDSTCARSQFGVQGCLESALRRREFLDQIGTLNETFLSKFDWLMEFR